MNGEKVLLTISRPADAAIAADRLFVRIKTDGDAVTCGAGEAADGVNRYAVTAAADQVAIEVSDFLLVTAGGVIAAGAEVMSDSAGKAVTWTPGNAKNGRYEGTANSATNERILIKFYRSGAEPDTVNLVTADGAIAVPSRDTTYIITKAGVAAMTIVDPTATTHDGLTLTFIAGTANAHTLDNSAGSGFNAAGAGSDVGTFGGAKGDNIVIVAYGGDWFVKSKVNVTLG